MQWIEDQPARSYVTGLTSNAILQERAREVVEQAKDAYARSGYKVTRVPATRYQARTWGRAPRRDQGGSQ
jgi:hypothetical protein